MNGTLIKGALGGASLLALAACGDMDADMDDMDMGAMRSGSSAAEAGCVQGVNTNYGREVASVVSSEFSEANTVVMLSAEGETWRCLVSNDGAVQDLAVTG